MKVDEGTTVMLVSLYGGVLASGLFGGMLNWSEIGTGWITVRCLFLLYDASANASMLFVRANLPDAKMLARSVSGNSVTKLAGSNRQRLAGKLGSMNE